MSRTRIKPAVVLQPEQCRNEPREPIQLKNEGELATIRQLVLARTNLVRGRLEAVWASDMLMAQRPECQVQNQTANVNRQKTNEPEPPVAAVLQANRQPAHNATKALIQELRRPGNVHRRWR